MMSEWETDTWQRANGFAAKGDTVVYLGRNGFDGDRIAADKVFSPGEILVVQYTEIGRSSSTYKFEGHPGRWNTVMFAAAQQSAPQEQTIEEPSQPGCPKGEK